MMEQLIFVIHIMACISLVILVLIQHGKGADIGAAFGSGASTTVFGSQGSGSFLLKITSLLAAVFFGTSLFLAYMASKQMNLASEAPMPIPVEMQQQPMPTGLSDDAEIPAGKNNGAANIGSENPEPLSSSSSQGDNQ